MNTVTYYRIRGVSKAKTAKAILFQREKDGLQSWLPTRIVKVQFTDAEYHCEVSAPDWFLRKVEWKEPVEYTPKEKPTNPYLGSDYGNLMEEKMVLEEKLDALVTSSSRESQVTIRQNLAWIDAACRT